MNVSTKCEKWVLVASVDADRKISLLISMSFLLSFDCMWVKTQNLPVSCMQMLLCTLYFLLILGNSLYCIVHRIVPVWFLVGACFKGSYFPYGWLDCSLRAFVKCLQQHVAVEIESVDGLIIGSLMNKYWWFSPH